MKCRKHIRTRRLNAVAQVGTDRVVLLTFGANDTAYHMVIELYDKGNIVLCDHNWIILQLLRPRSDGEDVRFAVHERYPIELATLAAPVTAGVLEDALAAAKTGDQLRKHLNRFVACGPSVVEHSLQEQGFPAYATITEGFDVKANLPRMLKAAETAARFHENFGTETKGYILLKEEKRADLNALPQSPDKIQRLGADADAKPLHEAAVPKAQNFFDEFHPFPIHNQHRGAQIDEHKSFDRAVDIFFSEIRAQKLELKLIAAEKGALKKLENVRNDHEKRLDQLQEAQTKSEMRALAIEMHLNVVDKAIDIVNSCLATGSSISSKINFFRSLLSELNCPEEAGSLVPSVYDCFYRIAPKEMIVSLLQIQTTNSRYLKRLDGAYLRLCHPIVFVFRSTKAWTGVKLRTWSRKRRRPGIQWHSRSSLFL